MGARHSSANSVTDAPMPSHQIKDTHFQCSLANSSILVMYSYGTTMATSLEALRQKDFLQLLFLFIIWIA
jgi:hypothetical protein